MSSRREFGAQWLNYSHSLVHSGSTTVTVWCKVAQLQSEFGAKWLNYSHSLVHSGSTTVTVWCKVAQLQSQFAHRRKLIPTSNLHISLPPLLQFAATHLHAMLLYAHTSARGTLRAYNHGTARKFHYIIIIIIIRHVYAGYVQLHTQNKPCLYGTQCHSCSAATIFAARNVISHVKCSVPLPLHQHSPQSVRSAQYGCFL